MPNYNAVASRIAILLLLTSAAVAGEDPWAHFIGKYTCHVEDEVDISHPRQRPQLIVFPDRQESLDFAVDIPFFKFDRDSCERDAELFASAIKAGGGLNAFTAKGVMDGECSNRLELVVSTFTTKPSESGQHYFFTDEFADQLDSKTDGGLSFHQGNLGNVIHLAGDWHFTYTERGVSGGLIWVSGQCARNWH